MRRAAPAAIAVVTLLALAGCSGGKGGEDDGPDVPAQAPEPFDRLSDRLAPGSGEAQGFAVEEDRVEAPHGGFMAFVTGRGMHCAGDMDPEAPNATGWVTCSVRLPSDAAAEAQGVHALGVGEDTQRLTLRMAAEPVEWRVAVTVLAETGAELVAFDSGWRPVDLSPRLSGLTLTFETTDPCDVPDAHEDQLGARRGESVLRLAFAVEHGQANATIDVARSIPAKADGAESSQRFLAHGYEAGFGFAGPRLTFRVNLTVDLEAAESPAAPPSSEGPCEPEPTLAQETQRWTATVTLRGADGQSRSADIAVDVPVGLAP